MFFSRLKNDVRLVSSIGNQNASLLDKLKNETVVRTERLDEKICDNKASLDKMNKHLNSELANLSDKIEIVDKKTKDAIISVEKQFEALFDANEKRLSNCIQKQGRDLDDLRTEISSNKSENETRVETLIEIINEQKNKSKKLEEQLIEDKEKIKELSAFSGTLLKLLKLFGAIAGSSMLVILVIIILIVSGVL